MHLLHLSNFSDILVRQIVLIDTKIIRQKLEVPNLMLNDHKCSRRNFCNGITATFFSLSHTSVSADTFCKICKLSRLHPARFLAGVIFDTIRSIIIKEVSYPVIQRLVERKANNYSQNDFLRIPQNEYYKGALIIAGEVSYDVGVNFRLKSMLLDNRPDQQIRIDEIKKFLLDNDIYLKSAYTSISYPIDENTDLDDLLSVEYFTSPSKVISDTEIMDDIRRLMVTEAIDQWAGSET